VSFIKGEYAFISVHQCLFILVRVLHNFLCS
jgi:hypothetical protein